MHGTDLSNNNSSADWTGVGFSFFKATEGLGFIDKTLAAWRAAADALSIPYGTYHFAHPDQNDPEDEADFFLSHSVKGHIAPALDCETRRNINPLSIMGAPSLGDWCNRWCRRVQSAWDQSPFFYSFRDMTARVLPYLDSWRLWLASGSGAPFIYQHFGGRVVAIEQWGIIGGIDQNESYTNILEEDAMADQGRSYSIVTPDKPYPADFPDPQKAGKDHRWKGLHFLTDGIVGTHVSGPRMENIYKQFGIGGPTGIDAEWMDNISILKTGEFTP